MAESLRNKKVVTLDKIDPFVDGTAVKAVGNKTFEIVCKSVADIIVIEEGKVCSTMIDLYQNEGIVAEPAGALSISSLDDLGKKIKGKTVVCILSGGNNDILRYPEIMEKSLVYKGLKHYFLIEFAQKPGQLKKLVDKVLGPTDDIVRFEYVKKSSKEIGPALLGIELTDKKDLKRLLKKMDKMEIKYTILKASDPLYKYLI
jgi:threonine dehydratase